MTKAAPTPQGSAGKVRRPRVMPDVVRALATDILGGRYAPGTLLPRENDLCTEHGVSRTVIREALKVLAAKGLVLGRPRIGTVVCDPEVWNIIDPQLIEWHSPETMDHRLLDAILETRRAIEPLVAEFAAVRATMQEIADVEAAWRGMADCVADVDGFTRHDIEYHRIIYAASHNPIFRQIGNLIDPALRFALPACQRSLRNTKPSPGLAVTISSEMPAHVDSSGRGARPARWLPGITRVGAQSASTSLK